MRILPALFRRARHGYALLVVMVSMALLLVVFASTIYWASTNANITLRNNVFNSSEAAAESSTENIMAYMIRDFNYGSLNPVSSYNTLTIPTNGWPAYYQFSDTNGNTAHTASITIGLISTTATNLNSQFTGLFGFVQPVEIASTATPQNTGINLSATVYQSLQFALIPLFQFAIFYNMDLEINPGAGMTINGHVHSNNNIWATGSGSSSSSLLIFSNSVDAAGTVSNLPSPLDPQNTGKSGNVFYADPNSPLQDYTSMSLPIAGSTNNNPTNVVAILNQPPAAYAPPNYSSAYSTNGMIYLANAADLVISNSTAGINGTLGTNITVYYQNPNNSPNYLTKIQPDALVASNVVSGTTVLTYNYSFVTNVSYYDYRESATVQAVQVDVSKLNVWLTNSGSQYNTLNTTASTSKGHGINSIFVYNRVPSVAGRQLPAVRMVNGSQLPPSGLTVASAVPMYIKGDYNTTTNGSTFSDTLGDTAHTAPASLLADSVTLLSSSWSDSWNSSTGLGSRSPTSMAVNAAMLEGIVPSNGAHYSGGVENFLRLLENWTGNTIVYNGSIVVMFPSQYATNFWQPTGNYYNAPTRRWGFDLNFLQTGKLPPLTPTVKAVLRNNYAAW